MFLIALYAIWGSSGSDVFAVGHEKILHYGGTSWTISKDGQENEYKSIWGTSASDVFAGGNDILHYSDGAADCTCEPKILPSAIHKLLRIASPVHVYMLIASANANFVTTDKPQWGVGAINTLASLQVSPRAIIALTYINPFQLDEGKYEVPVGNCTGTIEVKQL